MERNAAADLSGFKKAFEEKNLDALIACFAVDSVVHSPFTAKPIEGRDSVRIILGIILELLEGAKYWDELWGDDGTAALLVGAKIRALDIQVVDLIGFDSDGQINDFTVFVRPRAAGEALFEEVAPRFVKALEAAKA